MGKSRGSIAFFGTYRPPVPLDIFSCPADPPPQCADDELLLTDGESYNQNGHPILGAALKELLTFLGKKNPKLASECGATPEDAEKGQVAGLVFVSERDRGLETLHVALRFVAGRNAGKPAKVLSLGDIYGADTFGGVRMEDSGRVAGGFKIGRSTVGYSLVYVSTKEPVKARRTPWTVVYRTNLADGKTERLTPLGQYDLSPAVSPSGKMVAVANFQQSWWNGEIENLKTDIVVMNVDRRAQGGLGRRVLIKDGGWPTWGSDNVIFFHRGFDTSPPTNTARWGVFRFDIAAGKETRVTAVSLDIDAMTPAAISETKVAVATVREKSKQVEMKVDRTVTQYRHIEIFDTASPGQPPVQITQKTRPEGDYYNPFVLDGGRRVGYHRCRTDKPHKVQQGRGLRGISTVATIYVALCGLLGLGYWMLDMWRWFRKSVGAARGFDKTGMENGARELAVAPPTGRLGRRAVHDEGPQNHTGASSQPSTISIQRKFDKVQPPDSHADVGLFRVTGVFPSVSKNGKKLAFVDNEFKAVLLADSRGGLRVVYKVRASKSVFSTAWNQNDDLDTLYVCEGPAFSIDQPVQIIRIPNVSRIDYENIETFPLTDEQYNSAFPSTNGDGTKLVFRSSRNRVAGGERKHKNLYIIDAEKGEAAGVDKLTDGPWIDTQCSWSPREGCDWVVFSSSGRPEKDVFKGKDEPVLDHGLDPGYFAVYLVNAGDVKKGGKVPVPVRVIHSAPTIAGHINHPMFSPDMASIVFTADLAAVSADPISMPHFTHSVRPYGDIFSVDLRDTTDMAKNKDIQEFHRITHSRYEYATPTWNGIADGDEEDPNAKWKMLESLLNLTPLCPYAKGKAGEKEG